MANPCLKQILLEHNFWLQIMGDHSRFIHTTLAPKEMAHINRADQYIEIFDSLLAKSRQLHLQDEQAIIAITRDAFAATESLRDFKCLLLAKSLQCEVAIGLPPTFFNHMLNELEEYIRIMYMALQGQSVPAPPILHHHSLWIPDAYGHAASIKCELDPVEYELIKLFEDYEKTFKNYVIKTTEMILYTRSGLATFPALERFSQQAFCKMESFMKDLEKLAKERVCCTVLGTLLPLMADHMAREECYYLLKISSLQPKIGQIDCDPARPRLQE